MAAQQMNNTMAKIISAAMISTISLTSPDIAISTPPLTSKKMRERMAKIRMKPWITTSSLDIAIHSCLNNFPNI